MSQWNNKRNPCLTHQITSKLTRNIRRKVKKNINGDDIMPTQAPMKNAK